MRVERDRIRTMREGIAAFVMTLGIVAFCAALLVTGALRRPNVESEGWGGVAVTLVILVIAGLGREVYLSSKTNGRIWPWPQRRDAPNAMSSTCVAFYRQRLERQRRRSEGRSWYLAILVVAFLAVFLPLYLRSPMHYAIRLTALPVVLIGSLIGLAFLAKWREARRIRRELEALNTFEMESHQTGHV